MDKIVKKISLILCFFCFKIGQNFEGSSYWTLVIHRNIVEKRWFGKFEVKDKSLQNYFFSLLTRNAAHLMYVCRYVCIYVCQKHINIGFQENKALFAHKLCQNRWNYLLLEWF
jgi:hypothetical protein